MAENLIPTNLGFAEFVSTLIRETFDAVNDSYAQQIVRQEQIKNQLMMDSDSFAKQFVSDEEVLGEIIFFLGNEFQVEKPFITKETVEIVNLSFGLEISKDELAKGILTQDSVKQLFLLARLKIAKQKRMLLQKTFSSGNIPNFLTIDSGEIKAKVSFAVNRFEPKEKTITEIPTPPTKKNDEIKIGGSIHHKRERRDEVGKSRELPQNITEKSLAKPINLGETLVNEKKETFVLIDRSNLQVKQQSNPLPDIRLTVQQADSVMSNANLVSEVTIRFKAM